MKKKRGNKITTSLSRILLLRSALLGVIRFMVYDLVYRLRHRACARARAPYTFADNEVQFPPVRAHACQRNNDERVAQGNDRQIPSQDVSRFRNSFAERNKFLKDPSRLARFTAGWENSSGDAAGSSERADRSSLSLSLPFSSPVCLSPACAHFGNSIRERAPPPELLIARRTFPAVIPV